MNCPYCGAVLTIKNHCEVCGQDVTKFKKLFLISNRCYNRGLAKAHKRDLTGAIDELVTCLKIDKRNTDARNLLGLIYNEMGETVLALREWVISKNFKEDDNEAD